MSLRLDRRLLAMALLCLATVHRWQSPGQQPSDPLAGPRALLSEEKLVESEAALRSYLQFSPSSSPAHFLLGYVLFREKKAQDSLAQFTEGAKFERPHAGDLKIVASDYVLLGDYSDADRWFTEVVAATPQDADAWYLLGRTKYNENDIAAAVSSFQHVLTLSPMNVEAENNLGLCWKELNQRDKAQAAFLTAINWQGTAPKDAQPFLNLGTLQADGGELDKAIPNLTKAAELSPRNPKIYEELGDLYSARPDLAKAQDELEHAIGLAPDVAALHFKLGQIYRKQGSRDLAQKEFAMCARLNGAHSSAATPNPFILDRPVPPK